MNPPSSSPSGVHRTRGITLTFESELAALPNDVWPIVTTLRGVNHELGPWLHMTGPPDMHLDAAAWRSGALERPSWILLFRLIPLDRHRFAFADVTDGEGFREDSTSWLQRRWQHQRTIRADAHGTGSVIVDQLDIEPRLRGLGPMTRRVVTAVFRHRHRRLRRRFGTRPTNRKRVRA